MKRTNSTHRAWSDFPVGTRVEVVTEMQDHSFFRRDRGEVIENKGRYLGILVRFDLPRWYHKDHTFTCGGPSAECRNEAHYDIRDPFIFNFNPDDLMIEGEVFAAVTRTEIDSPFGALPEYAA